jgi:hypothetical protein
MIPSLYVVKILAIRRVITMKAPNEACSTIIAQFSETVKTLVTWFNQHQETNALEAEKMFWQTLNGSLALAMQECFGLLGTGYSERTLPCECGGQLEAHSLRPKIFVTTTGTVELTRYYYYCRTCKASRFPLDEQLGFSQVEGQGAFSPLVCTQMLLLGVHLPFAKAAQIQSELTQAHLSPEAVRQVTEGVGAKIEGECQAEEKAAFPTEASTPSLLKAEEVTASEPLPILYGSMDGAMTPIRPLEGEGVDKEKAHYEESKLVCFYQTRPLTASEEKAVEREAKEKHLPEWERQRSRSINQSYISYLGGPEVAGQRAWLEGRRRGALTALLLIFLGDGAPWIWKQIEQHWPNAVQILDWFHACEHLAKVALLLYGEGTRHQKEREIWYRNQQGYLWSGEGNRVVETLKGLSQLSRLSEKDRGEIERERAYFECHWEAGRLNYREFREKGYQIGSGTIESGCKQVVKARLSGNGMHWNRTGAQFIENVRSYVLSNRIAELEQMFDKSA